MALGYRARNVLQLLLTKLATRERPLIFVTHSLGGLLVKRILMYTQLYDSGSWKRFSDQVKGVVFIATPHTGSSIASHLKYIGLLVGATRSIRELEQHDETLSELNEWYVEYSRNRNILNQVYFETRNCYRFFRVVDATSASLPFTHPVPIAANHIGICKLTSRDPIIYAGVKRLIEDIIAEPVLPPKTVPAGSGALRLRHEKEKRQFVIQEGEKVEELPQDLPRFPRDLGLFVTQYARYWKQVHTISEELYTCSRKYQDHIRLCKAAVEKRLPEQVDHHCREAVRLLNELLRQEWKHRTDRLERLPKPVSDTPPIEMLRKLPLCIDPLLRGLGAGSLGEDLEAAIALSESIEAWQLETLHFADLVLEEYFAAA